MAPRAATTCLPAALLAAGATATNKAGKDFLMSNKQAEGVTTLPSGLQYKVLQEGDGEAHPLPSTDCSCHYEGRTAQEFIKTPKGKTFDSSYSRGSPANFSPSGVIAGWTEALQLMVEGDKWELYIPSELGYGDGGSGADIGPGDALVFTIELLKINGGSTPAERGPPPYDTLADLAAFEAWTDAPKGTPLVLALLKQPLRGKLFDGFKAAARATEKLRVTEKAGAASSSGLPVTFAISAESKFDGRLRGYTPSAVESATKLSAPGVYVAVAAGGGGGSAPAFEKCKVAHTQKGVGPEEIKKTLLVCVAAATGLFGGKVKDEV